MCATVAPVQKVACCTSSLYCILTIYYTVFSETSSALERLHVFVNTADDMDKAEALLYCNRKEKDFDSVVNLKLRRAVLYFRIFNCFTFLTGNGYFTEISNRILSRQNMQMR